MNTTIKPEAVEHVCNSLNRDYRLVRKAVLAEDPDRYTQIMLTRLQSTINDAQRMLKDMSKQLSDKK
jgi:hypothetical protein